MTSSSELGKLSNIKSANSRVVPMSNDSFKTESTFGANNSIKVVNQSLKDANAQEENQTARQASEPKQEG